MKFQLETDLSGVSITHLDSNGDGEYYNCTLLYAVYKRVRPIPSTDRTANNHLTRWTEPFVTHNNGLAHLSLWEPGVLYRLPQVALRELMEGDDLCAAPLSIEIQHTPYSGFAVDEYNRGSADGKQTSVITALHIGAHTPCIVAPRDTLVDWIDRLGSRPDVLPFFTSAMDRRALRLSWLKPLARDGDVRVERLPGLLDHPVELIREEVFRETA